MKINFTVLLMISSIYFPLSMEKHKLWGCYYFMRYNENLSHIT